jgi:hexokinase
MSTTTGRIEQEFALTTQELIDMITNFKLEMAGGLKRGPRDSSLQMIPSYVFNLPRGTEHGQFLAIDLGGSNFRLLRMILSEGGKCEVFPKLFALTDAHMTSDAETLFGFIAECLLEFAPETIGAAENTPLGFTFSFPVQNTSISHGFLTKWTKGFSATGCVGNDVSALLETELKKRNMSIKVGAIINDTVATMMAKTLEYKDCFLGLIIGTGTNACYYEKVSNVEKWDENEMEMYKNEEGVVINIEWGNYGAGKTNPKGSGQPSILPWTVYDQIVDSQSLHPHEQLLEKMISGKYQGEILRQLVLAAIASGELFGGIKTPGILRQEALVTADVSHIESDAAPEYAATRDIFAKLGYSSITDQDCITVLDLTRTVSVRAARLTAAACAAVILFAGGAATKSCTIAVDGSVFTHHPTFHRIMNETLEELREQLGFGPVQFVSAHMGSGTGAAIVVAAAARGFVFK